MDLKPGHNLDALIAEKVMGLTNVRLVYIDDMTDNSEVHLLYGESDPGFVPKYSTDIAAAWEVVEKIRSEKKCLFDIQEGENNNGIFYQVQIDKFNSSGSVGGLWDLLVESTEGQSIPHAICLAALKAVTSDIPK